MKTIKTSKGITLISLIVTIIVLLILAGVSISILTGENGIITKSKEASEQTRRGEVKEELNLIGNEWNIEKRTNRNANLLTFLAKQKTDKNIDDYEDLQDGSCLVIKDGQEIILEQGTTNIWNGTSVSTALLGNGTEEEPFLIRNGEDLKFLANAVSNKSTYTLEGETKGYKYACYKQVKDIYLNDTSNFSQWNDTNVQAELNSFLPIGYNETNREIFFGKYDGNNHKIDGLYVNIPNDYYAGLFSLLYYTEGTDKVVDAEICNLQLKNAYIRAKEWAGGIAGGISSNAKIKNCQVDGFICVVERNNPDDWANWGAGGICGEMTYGSLIEDCTNYAKIKGDVAVGGICGKSSSSSIKKCNNYGTVIGCSKVGGISGEISSCTVDFCNNYENISYGGSGESCTYFGGIGGDVYGGTISNCNNFGRISVLAPNLNDLPVMQIGGIAGLIQNESVLNSNNSGNIDINVGSLRTGLGIGGVVGYLVTGSTVDNCNNTGIITTNPTIKTTGNIIGIEWGS